MALGMVVAGAALGWIGLAMALVLGQPIWLALLLQWGVGASLVLLWALALMLRSRAWLPDPAHPAVERARLQPR